VVLGVSVTSIIAMIGTFSGHGPLLLNPAASAGQRTLVLQLFIACTCLMTLPVGVALTRRKWLERRLAVSENEYRMLAEYSRDMVVRIDEHGRRRYISPAATEILGWPLEELRDERWDLIHPDDVPGLMVVMSKLRVEGGRTTAVFRVQHRDGHYVWIEAHARLVPSADPAQAPDIIYAGRDISRRIKAEQDLARNQRRLRAIADNTPAFVVHVDTEKRYTFANAYAGRTLGTQPAALIGRAVEQMTDEKVYKEIKPYVDRALRGETVTFESEREYGGEVRHFQCTYVPDRTPDGKVVGVYGMVYDVSDLKLAERKLEQLARHDSLTGLANRLQFNERVALALARRQRTLAPIALLYLDIDRFKHINDTKGHAVGDAILVGFAQRLRECVRETDLVARLGGDEFVVLVEDIDSPAVAETIARKLIDNLSTSITVPGCVLPVTTSIGIAFSSRTLASGDQFIKLADEALYAAKAAGRNTYRIVVA
jgi:diguanylate cyclase (GGDEF)-like protein/PAS domain S-box-containing protein